MRARLVLLATAAVALLALRKLRPFRVEVAGSSMVPTLNPGDWLVATRGGAIHRGSVVVLADPRGGRDLVKRVGAVPGDILDGRALSASEFMVLGDNRSASTDGRIFGPVSREAIEGVVRFRYWPHPAPIGSGYKNGGALPRRRPQARLSQARSARRRTRPRSSGSRCSW